MNDSSPPPIANRFRGFLPVVVDVETGGFNPQRHALLEVAAIPLVMHDSGVVAPGETISWHVHPFPGSLMDAAAMEVNRIQVNSPFRMAKSEREMLEELFRHVRKLRSEAGCKRAILTGHNAAFDLAFLNAAISRCQNKRNPFHPFSCLDTVSLGALAYGQTVLARACEAAGIPFNQDEAHSARYDAEQTAALFCKIINEWHANVNIPCSEEVTEDSRDDG